MATTTTNFGWDIPQSTDLVKDGATAIAALGQDIDTAFVDLKGGTTGQVLAKASNTDLDYSWVDTDDTNAIQNAIVDAKGDLIAATAADTPARLAVGNNGETLVADSSTATGLAYQANWAAGKNKIINGDFFINQRNFTSNTTAASYNFDRFYQQNTGGTFTVTPQTFTPGAAPVAGYEGKTFLRGVTASQSAAADFGSIRTHLESVRTLAGQKATLSFWAKAGSGTPKIGATFLQIFGSGGSSPVVMDGQSTTISTSWVRYSLTFDIPSLSGKTIGTSNDDYLRLELWYSSGSDTATRSGSIGIQNNTFDIWGVQLEAGSVATAFQTATGTIQGELAACQRYYYRLATGAVKSVAMGSYYSASYVQLMVKYPVTMRTTPTLDANSGTDYFIAYRNGASDPFNSLTLDTSATTNEMGLLYNASETSGTAGWATSVFTNNAATYVGFGAEL